MFSVRGKVVRNCPEQGPRGCLSLQNGCIVPLGKTCSEFWTYSKSGTLATKFSRFWIYWAPCERLCRILDLLEPLRQAFRIEHVLKSFSDTVFRILDLLGPLRQTVQNLTPTQIVSRHSFQNFGPTGTLATILSQIWIYWDPCATKFSGFWTYLNR